MAEQTLIRSQQYYARRELGLCTRCGAYMPNNEYYITCEECRRKARKYESRSEQKEWRREYMRMWRAKEKAMLEQIAKAVQKLAPTDELKSDRREVPPEHKCWQCEWGRFHEDRFFCPLVGCVKENRRTNED